MLEGCKKNTPKLRKDKKKTNYKHVHAGHPWTHGVGRRPHAAAVVLPRERETPGQKFKFVDVGEDGGTGGVSPYAPSRVFACVFSWLPSGTNLAGSPRVFNERERGGGGGGG